ncbi:MAG: hypothetical protein JKY61_09555 [Planctomycetes bacterium]|nr:hypothetical protein [Planctomycetota bacterium]
MNLHRSILLTASLCLAACNGIPFQGSASHATASSGQLTVHVVEASGGA